MSEEQAHQSPSDANNPEIPNSATSEYVPEVETEQENTSAQSEPSCNKEHPPITVKVDVYFPKDKSYWSNGTQIASVLVSAAMLFVTYLLFVKTKDSVDIARDSLSQFIQTDSLNRRGDRIRDSLDSIQREFDYTRDTTNIAFSRKSVNAQINSLKEAQRQNQIENSPYLECQSFFVLDFEINKAPSVQFVVKNLGTKPAKVINTKYHIRYGDIYADLEDFLSKKVAYTVNPSVTYINDRNQQTFNQPSIDKLSKSIIDAVFLGKLNMYMIGQIDYLDEASGKERSYIFWVDLYPSPKNAYNMIWQDNLKYINVDKSYLP